MAAGECICLAYEIGREHDVNFEADYLDDLCETLKELSKDSHKFRAKKDRKTQRASFREILSFIQVSNFSGKFDRIPMVFFFAG